MITISNDRKDDAKWKEFCKKYKTIYGEDAVISIRFKRDHKKQKRIQCAISYTNFKDKVLKDNIVQI